MEKIRIQELPAALYLFAQITAGDKAYLEIFDKNISLSKKEDVDLLLIFLRKWGCRQFYTKDTDITTKNLMDWDKKNVQFLPNRTKNILQTTKSEIKTYVKLFDSLAHLTAAKNNNSLVTVGPVGAAKILFVLRKNIFIPWDKNICEKLGYSKDGKGYYDYLIYVKEILTELKEECKLSGIDFNKILTILDKSSASLTKLVDEYFFIKYTKKIDVRELKKISSEAFLNLNTSH